MRINECCFMLWLSKRFPSSETSSHPFDLRICSPFGRQWRVMPWPYPVFFWNMVICEAILPDRGPRSQRSSLACMESDRPKRDSTWHLHLFWKSSNASFRYCDLWMWVAWEVPVSIGDSGIIMGHRCLSSVSLFSRFSSIVKQGSIGAQHLPWQRGASESRGHCYRWHKKRVLAATICRSQWPRGVVVVAWAWFYYFHQAPVNRHGHPFGVHLEVFFPQMYNIHKSWTYILTKCWSCFQFPPFSRSIGRVLSRGYIGDRVCSKTGALDNSWSNVFKEKDSSALLKM